MAARMGLINLYQQWVMCVSKCLVGMKWGGGDELDRGVASLMSLMKSVGSWLTCASSPNWSKWQSKEKDFPSLALPLMRTAMVSGTVKGDRGTGEGVTGAWWDGLERGERRQRGHSGSECWPRYGEVEFKKEFHLPYASTTANEYVSLSFTTS